MYVPPLACECGLCTCQISSKLIKERETELIHLFLNGPDDDAFRSLRSNVMTMDPLPNLNKVFSLAVQEERHLTVVKDRDAKPPDPMALAAQHRQGAQRPTTRPTCSHCGCPGHDITKCYRLHGFPEGFVFTNGRGKNSSGGNPSPSPQGSGVVMVGVPVSPTPPNNHFLRLGTRLSLQVIGSLLATLLLLRNGIRFFKPSPPSMPNRLQLSRRRVSIKLPDNRLSTAVHEGSLIFSPSVRIDHVLYIPNLDCNLISFSQLAITTQCVITLTDKLCIIQERTSRTMIDVGEQRGGVYWLISFGPQLSKFCLAASSISVLSGISDWVILLLQFCQVS